MIVLDENESSSHAPLLRCQRSLYLQLALSFLLVPTLPLFPLIPLPPLLLQELNHRGMPTRGYVLIFVFWALLTIITPTLVSWSASAKPNLVAPGETLLEMKVNRRMMGSVETAAQQKNGTRKTIPRATAPSPAAAPAPAPAAGHDVLS